MKDRPPGIFERTEKSVIWTVAGVIFLFSTAILATLIAPNYVDDAWIAPSSSYQVQVHTHEDPYLYVGHADPIGEDLQYVRHLKSGISTLAFKESSHLKIIAPPDLEKYITKAEEVPLKLTKKLMLLRLPKNEMKIKAKELKKQLENHSKDEKLYEIFELYDPQKDEAISYEFLRGVLENWVEKDFMLIDETSDDNSSSQSPTQAKGRLYIENPREFRVKSVLSDQEFYTYDPKGRLIETLDELLSIEPKFESRESLIAYGEKIYAAEGCYYCHTEQTRTLIQDVVLNGTDAYPAPPSSPNEYVYQKITFLGTRRIGPDLSRTGVKRPSRDWHMSHFWEPTLIVKGSIMPKCRHFFSAPSPLNTNLIKIGVPNREFEAMYQYLMIKGTRITSPTKAWWTGRDPVNTKEIIESYSIQETVKNANKKNS